MVIKKISLASIYHDGLIDLTSEKKKKMNCINSMAGFVIVP